VTGRRGVGALLIAVSLLGLVAAFLDLPVEFHLGRAATALLSRTSVVLWLAATLGLGFATRWSIASRDKTGSTLGSSGLCLLVAYLGVKYLAGIGKTAEASSAAFLYEPAHSMLAAIVALAFSVAANILGWHLLMIPDTVRSGRGVVDHAHQADATEPQGLL